MAAITGSYLYQRFQQKSGQAYTGYFPVGEFNIMIEEALTQASESRYGGTQDQKNNDELLSLITTSNNIPLINNNKFLVAPLAIISLTVSGTTWTLTTVLPHNILAGQLINIAGVSGFSVNPSGTYTVVTAPTPTTLTFTTTTATGTYTSNSGIVNLINGQLTDYFHALAIKAYFSEPLYSTNVGANFITNATNTSPIIVTFSDFNNLRSDEQINISGITGNTNANGTWYLQKLSLLSAALFSDKDLQVPSVGNGAFGGTPVVNKIYFNYCTRLLPDERISPLIKPSSRSPRYIMSDGGIIIHPLDRICSQVSIDYKRRALNVYGTNIFIDGNDNILDLTTYYNEKFLYSVLDLVILMAAGEQRDSSLSEFETQQLNNNP